MSPISEELLAKFLNGLCTEEEAAVVEAYFLQHPEDVSMLAEYEDTDAVMPLPDGYREEMLERIVAETAPEEHSGRARVRRMTVLSAAAACILLVLTGWWLLSKVRGKAGQEPVPQVAAVWIGRHNADSKKIRLRLPDSSDVILSPGATIRYRKDFGAYDKREIKVEGQALFSVVKNDHVPFVVMSEMVSTVVMGTVFEVMADKDSSQIRVRLEQGKVMVLIDQDHDTGRHYILKPGEEFVFGKWNGSVVIRDFVHGPAFAHRAGRPAPHPDTLTNWYMFNNQPLDEVFDQLSLLYNIDIEYSRQELQHIYFIGLLERKDSLGETLSDIALLNHLKVTRREGRFIITKRKP
jgi:transmembrane sensor